MSDIAKADLVVPHSALILLFFVRFFRLKADSIEFYRA